MAVLQRLLLSSSLLAAVGGGICRPGLYTTAFASLGNLQHHVLRPKKLSPPQPFRLFCHTGSKGGSTDERVKRVTLRWIEKVVVGLNLCPWANSALVKGQIRVVVSGAKDEDALLQECIQEIQALSELPPAPNATTVIVTENLLSDFVMDYIPFTAAVDDAIDGLDLRGVVQLATFHPQYQFGHLEPEDSENWTNRAPYPILHLLREKEISDALDKFGDPDKVWIRNEKLMRVKGSESMQNLVDSCLKDDGDN